VGHANPGTPPNILLLFTDQQRADTIAALGNPVIRTPTLDRFAREGTAFTRAYTPSPVCVPARHALITGLPPHRSGVVDNVEDAPPARSIMEVLTGCGYQTHGVGKMHFASGDPRRSWGFASRDYSEELDPTDDYVQFLAANGFGHVLDPHGFRSEYYYLPQPSQVPAHLHHTAWVADRSIDFLRRRDRRRPFFLWSSFIKPHPPFETPNPWSRLYRSADMPDPIPADGAVTRSFWQRVQNRYKYMDGGANPHLVRTQRAAYYAAISFIDYHVGRLLAELGEAADNTLIVFASDHGEMLGDFGCFGKRCMREAAARVPLIVRQPGVFAPGGRCGQPVSLLDLFPTFAAAARAPLESPTELADDLARVVRERGRRTHMLSQFSQRSLGLYMAAEAEWKYIYSTPDRREWLFHLATDPHEQRDLSTDPSSGAHLERLRGHLIRQFERDGYTAAVQDGHWRHYGPVELPDDPRGGLLFQDPPGLAAGLNGLAAGYNHAAAVPRSDWLAATQPDAMDPLTGLPRWPAAPGQSRASASHQSRPGSS
jgi:arylsulfatase